MREREEQAKRPKKPRRAKKPEISQAEREAALDDLTEEPKP